MKSVATAAVSLLIGFLVAYLLLPSGSKPLEPDAPLPASIPATESRSQPDLEVAIAALNTQLTNLQEENATLREKLATSENMVAVMEDSFDDVAADAVEEDEENSFSDMFDGMDTDEMAKTQAKTMVAMSYGNLFKQLSLDRETKVAVREILEASSAEQYSGYFNQSDELDESILTNLHQVEEERSERLRGNLAQVLTKDELEIFDNYDVEREMLASSMDGTLRMFASDLTPENHEIALEVLVDEMYAMQSEVGLFMEESLVSDEEGMLDAASSYTEMQTNALINAVNRLAVALDPDQLASFQDFVDQQTSMYESISSMTDFISDDDEVETVEGGTYTYIAP